MAGGDSALASRVASDFRTAQLPAHELALLEFVETLTLAPFEIDALSRSRLRSHGWSERNIARAALGSAHFNYLNRMADGLGIRLDYTVGGEHAPGASLDVADPDADTGPVPDLDPLPTTSAVGDEQAAPLIAAIAFNPVAAYLVNEWRRYHLTGTPALPDALRARLAVYCAAVAHAPASLRWAIAGASKLCVTGDEIDRLSDQQAPSSDPLVHAMFEHAFRLTTQPGSIARDQVRSLLALGLGERDLLQLTMLIAYLSFEHRAAFGLGIAD